MAIKALAKGDALDLELIGVVGDGWAENPITSKAIAKVLADNKDAKTINVSLNSPGGYVVEGLQIYQALVDHPARVVVTVGGQAASCGSLIAMAGDEIVAHETSLFMIHNPWNFTVGDYQEHEKSASRLKMMADVFAGAYAARSGMSKDDVRVLMDQDRYMDAEEAKNLGFFDRIIPSKNKNKALSTDEARAVLSRSRSFAMNNLMRTAAAALLIDTHEDAPTQSQPEATENTQNMAILAALAATLGIECATESDALAAVGKLNSTKGAHSELLTAIGAKTQDEALGALKGLKDAAEAGATAVAEVAKIREQARKEKHAALIASASKPQVGAVDPANPHAGKLVPAQVAWAESVPTETLEGFLANAPVVLAGDGAKEPHTQKRAYSGKSYNEMSFMERHELAKSDPDLFAQLSRDYEEAQS